MPLSHTVEGIDRLALHSLVFSDDLFHEYRRQVFNLADCIFVWLLVMGGVSVLALFGPLDWNGRRRLTEVLELLLDVLSDLLDKLRIVHKDHCALHETLFLRIAELHLVSAFTGIHDFL